MADIKEMSEKIKKYTNEFSFTDTIGDFVINEKFKTGLTELKSGYNNKNTYIWEVLSVMNTDISETIYENVLNYIDNISNVDTCKIPSLRSMLKQIGVEYSLFSTYNDIPLQIRPVVDIMSINKRYLQRNDFLKTELYNEIMRECFKSGEKTTEDIRLTTQGYIDDDKFHSYVEQIFYTYLNNIVNLKYNDRKDSELIEDCIWYKLRDYLLNGVNEVKVSEFIDFKLKHNIDVKFNEVEIVDSIYENNDSLNNYDGYNLELLKMEIKRREQPISIDRPNTKYYYYDEKTVKECFDFIEYKFTSLNNLNMVSNDKYDVDNNYILITDKTKNVQEKLISYENGKYYINDVMIRQVASNLTDITIEIQKLREKIKLEVQKHYMRGTYNLLKYIINEYLIGLSRSKIFSDKTDDVLREIHNRLSCHQIIDINHIEYYDTTEYFNIDSGVVKSNELNERYWEQHNDDQTGFAFDNEQIHDFYHNVLNCKDNGGSVNSFLCSLYEYGATKTHMEDGRVIYYSEEDKIDQEYEILMSYGGQTMTYHPYFNHKNSIHPSFQLHPYLNRFITYHGYEYPIINAFNNDANYGLEDMVISGLVGEYGETINVALNNQYDFSGYRTRYEESPHTVNGNKSDLVDYDGAFFTNAAIDFRNHTDDFIKSVRTQSISKNGDKTYYEKYYSHLGLSKTQTNRIADQLQEYQSLIKEIVSEKEDVSEVYDIYKYAMDRYDNIYILFKKYENKNPTHKEKQNTTGQLWIRLKNHPIALPAFYGENPAVDNDKEFINGNIHLLAEDSDAVKDSTYMSYFYDFEIDESKRTIMLLAYPVNDYINHNVTILEDEEKFKKYEFADIIICNFEQLYDSNVYYDKLRFLSDTKQHLTFVNTSGIIPVDKVIASTKIHVVNCILGIFNQQQTTNVLYIQKTLDEDNNNVYIEPSDELTFTLYSYSYRAQNKESGNIKLQLGDITNKYHRVSDDIQFSYYDGSYTFAFLVKPYDTSIKYRTYVGMNGYGVQVDDTDISCESDCYNSYDIMKESICIYEAFMGTFEFISGKPKIYNLNVDASYMPQFAGLKGFHDYTHNSYLDRQNIKSIQLMGRSTNLLRDIEHSVARDKFFSFSLIEKLNDYMFGRIYEDYYEAKERNKINSFKIETMPWRSSYIDDNNNIWYIDIDCNDSILSATNIIFGNKFTTQNNLYFVGSIAEISSDNPEHETTDGFISLREKYHSYDEQQLFSEVVDSKQDCTTVAGTYNMYSENSNKPTSNHLFGINDIQIKFEGSTKQVMIKFIKNQQWMINDNELYFIQFNDKDLTMYEWYHLVEPVLLGYKRDEMLSVQLSDYTELSNIPQLSGYDSLAFKYSEEDTFAPSAVGFWYPGYNKKYPLQIGQIFNELKDDYKTANYSNRFLDINSTYILKLNDMSQLFENGEILLPLKQNMSNQLMVLEDYLSTDSDGYSNSNKYDTTSIKMVEYTLNGSISSMCDISTITEYINSKGANEYISADLETLWMTYGLEVLHTEDESTDELNDIKPLVYTPVLSNLNSIEKFNNIFVQYEKNQDGITLYFNYMNYYNTPFVKLENGVQVNRVMDNAYLKLLPGQDGIIDIDIQIRNYDDYRSINALANVRIASYRIFNVSDDKPKFIIQRITDGVMVLVDKDEYKELFATIQLPIKVINMNDSEHESSDGKIQFHVDVIIDNRCPISSMEYRLMYNKDNLEYIPENIDKVENDATNGILTVKSKNSIKLGFKTKKSKNDYISEQTEPRFTFNIIDSECYSRYGDFVECEYFNGFIKCVFDRVLRLESDNENDLILLQNNDSISIKG